MLAVLETWEEEGQRWQDHTLLYLSLILFKVGLNALTLALCSQSLRRSFMGLSGASLCLVDVLLLCGTAYIWLFRHLNSASSLCLLLSHSSTVYSLLPLPFLLLGALDYCTTLSPVSRPMSLHRTRSCCMVLLSIWALACFYSYHRTSGEVIIATDGEPMLLCAVQDSSVAFYFCAGTSLAIAAVLLYYSQRAPQSFRAALRLARQWDASPAAPHCDLPLSYRKPPQPAAAAKQAEGLPDPPLLLRFTLGFSLYWIPFLGVNMACRLLNLATPSYVTVNLLWVLCANSVLIGTVLWLRSWQPGPCGDPPDDTCRWSVYKLQSGGDQSKLQEKLSQGIYTLSSRDTDKLLYV